MYNWFECKVKYERLDEQGAPRKVNELYLVDALTFTEAETRICKEMEPYIHGGTEFQVANIRRANISEMFEDDTTDDVDHRWYRFRIITTIIDEEKGVEKKVASNVYVEASDIFEAVKNLQSKYQSSFDYTVSSITETAVMDVYRYVSDSQISAQIQNASKEE